MRNTANRYVQGKENYNIIYDNLNDLLMMENELFEEYLNKHLPYRINGLLAHDLILYRKKLANYNSIKDTCYGDSLILEPAFEISPIFGRSLLNFLGLGIDSANKKIDRKEPWGTDISIKSLFPDREFCPIDDPIILEYNVNLVTIIKLADKSVAHMTSVKTEEREHEKLPEGCKAIYDLLLKYVPEINKQEIWWYMQVESK